MSETKRTQTNEEKTETTNIFGEKITQTKTSTKVDGKKTETKEGGK